MGLSRRIIVPVGRILDLRRYCRVNAIRKLARQRPNNVSEQMAVV
jgi:hypothetical protein